MTLSHTPTPEARERLAGLVDALPFNDQIPRRSGDVAFDQAWEIRAFSIATALHADGRFQWPQFQSQLVDSIKTWESEHETAEQWSYYERWLEALEELVGQQGFITGEELDARTQQILDTPANANHQHAVRDPITVEGPHSTSSTEVEQ